jgi:hypothetical protein
MEIYGVYSITNCFSLIIIDIKYDIEDYVKVALCNGETYTRPTWCKVRYNAHGEAYFIKYKRRYYLKDIERVMKK